jgi:hypothetical protein
MNMLKRVSPIIILTALWGFAQSPLLAAPEKSGYGFLVQGGPPCAVW